MRGMKKALVSSVIGIAVSLAIIFAPASTSALGIFGFNFGNAQPTQTQVASTTSATLGDVSTLVSDVSQNLNDACLQFTNHEYEVCTAYVFNSSVADLVPYYAYVHSTNTSLARFVQYRLGSRYSGPAARLIQNRVASWPVGDNDVVVPDIQILAVDSSLAANTATLVTQESWQVATESGQVLYTEADTPHTITMHRVPSYILHKWVVTNID